MEGSLVAYKVFTNGSVLNASEINENLMNQSVMVFSNSTARAAALTAPVEGMLTWLQDTNKYENYNGTAWVALGGGVLQVVSTVKSDTFSMASTTYADITGLSVSITPASSSSKIFVVVDGYVGSAPGSVAVRTRLVRGSTAISIGDTAGTRTLASTDSIAANSSHMTPMAISFLDSPATTSATTYKVQMQNTGGGATTYLNRSSSDTDGATARTASSITVMEIAG